MFSTMQKYMFILGCMLLAACVLMPPWIRVVQGTVIDREAFRSILDSPGEYGWKIDYSMLALRSILLMLLTASGLFVGSLSKAQRAGKLFPRLRGASSPINRKGVDESNFVDKKLFSSEQLAKRLLESMERQDNALSIALLKMIAEVKTPTRELAELVMKSASHNDEGVRLGAARALGYKAFSSPATISVLAQCTRDKSTRIRHQAFMSLSESGQLAYNALPELIAALSDSDSETVLWAVLALGNFQQLPPSLRSDLARLLEDDDRGVREFTAIAIAKHFPNHTEAIPILARLASDESEILSARSNAIRALGNFGEFATRAMPVIISVLEGKDTHLQTCAIDTLSKMGKAALPAAQHLIEVAKSPDNPNATFAAQCLASVGLLEE